MKSLLYLIWHCFNQANTMVHGLDHLPQSKREQKGEKRKDGDRQMSSNSFDLGPNSTGPR